MANSEGPVGQPPAAWVWSHYRGVVGDARPSASAPETAAANEAAHAAPATAIEPEQKNPTLIGAGVAAAVLVIAGLTWLFTSQPASSPAPAASESVPAKSDAAPPAAEPAPPAGAAEAPKAEAPAAHDHPGKKKKH